MQTLSSRSVSISARSKRDKTLALLALLLLALIWGYNWIVMKLAVQDAPPFAFAALRAFLGAVALFGVMAWQRRSFRPRHLWSCAGVGLLQSGGGIGLATWALVQGGVGKTAILLYTMSFWTPLLSWLLLRERLNRWQMGAIALALVGLAFLLSPFDLSADGLSKGIATLAGLSWALSAVLTKWANRRQPIDLLSFTAWQMLFGSLPLLLVVGLLPNDPIHWTPSFVWALFYNAVPSSALAWMLWLYALKHLSASTAGLGSLATPLLGMLLGWLRFGEVPSPSEAAGMALIALALGANSLQATVANRFRPR